MNDMWDAMWRETRGVLHLDKYSPPKAIFSVGERGEEKRKKKEKEKNEESQ